MTLLFELLGSAAVVAGAPAGMAMLAAVVAAGMVCTLVVPLRRDPVPARAHDASAVRHRGEHTVFLPLCDPAAAGRPRPRAPSARHRAA